MIKKWNLPIVAIVIALVLIAAGCSQKYSAERDGKKLGEAACDLRDADSPDEIEAALDEANVIRLVELVRDLTDRSQFIMITHNKRSMEFADTLFGITMEQKGVSKVVSVNLKRPEAQAA